MKPIFTIFCNKRRKTETETSTNHSSISNKAITKLKVVEEKLIQRRWSRNCRNSL